MNMTKSRKALAIVGLATVAGSMATPFAAQAKDKAAAESTTTGSIPTVELSEDGKITQGDALANKTMSGAWNNLIGKYRFWIAGISGIAAVSMILFFIINFMKLGATSGNPNARSAAISGLVWTGLAAAGLGGVSIVVGFFYNALG